MEKHAVILRRANANMSGELFGIRGRGQAVLSEEGHRGKTAGMLCQASRKAN
jgi:hypothetical protein